MRLIGSFLLILVCLNLHAQSEAERPYKLRNPNWMFSLGYGINKAIPSIQNSLWHTTFGYGGPKVHLSSQVELNVARRVVKNYWINFGMNKVNREYKIYNLDPYNETIASSDRSNQGMVTAIGGNELLIGFIGRHKLLKQSQWFIQWGIDYNIEFLTRSERTDFDQTSINKRPTFVRGIYSRRSRATAKIALQWEPMTKVAFGIEPSYSSYLRDFGNIKTPDKLNLHSLALSLKAYLFL